MRYTQILHTAKELAIKNPLFWLFGLVLYGGFNVYAVNFFALTNSIEVGISPSLLMPHQYMFLILAGIILFVVMNNAKILFIVIVHNELHDIKQMTCATCVIVSTNNTPYFTWLRNVLIASSITILMTSTIAYASGFIISAYAQNNGPVIIMNVIFTMLVACIIGTWNLFTSYFVVMHNLSFSKASSAALDLIITRLRIISEFIVTLLLLYGAAAIIGNAFIYVWQEGIAGADLFSIRIVALTLFVIWFAFNNTFFNIAFVVFFDALVKSIGSEDKKLLGNGQLSSNILN